MGFRSEILEAVAVAPVRKTMLFAAVLLGLLVVFSAAGDTAFARGKPTTFDATAFILSIDAGDVTAAGESGRFVVKNRMVGGVADDDLAGLFSATFGTNVPILSQSGSLHGDLSLGGDDSGNFAYGASFVAKSSLVALSGTVPTDDLFVGFEQFTLFGDPVGDPVFGHIAGLEIDGKMTFTSGTQGHGSVSGIFWVIVDPITGHIIGGAVPGQEITNVLTASTGTEFSGFSMIGMSGSWHQEPS